MRAYCTSCGAPMEAEDRHCPRCGRPQTGPLLVRSTLEADAERPAPVRPEPRQPEPPPYIRPRPRPEPSEGGPNRRLLLLAGIVLVLLIFVVGLTIGRLTSTGSKAAAGRAAGAGAPAVVTPTPSAAPTPTPTPINHAQFVSVNQTITDRCSTANGCPVSATFKNQGPGRGSGTAKLDVVGLQDSVVYASCTVPIPDTDPGGTATVSCSANSPELANYWKTGPGALVKPQASTTT